MTQSDRQVQDEPLAQGAAPHGAEAGEESLAKESPAMQTQLDQALHFQSTALNLRAQRQAVIASNIANADTPNYKARDLDFGAALEGALGGRLGRPLALSTTAVRHIDGQAQAVDDGTLKYRSEQQSSVDGNTVDVDTERAAFAENALQYEASLTFINGLLRSMQQAVQGQ